MHRDCAPVTSPATPRWSRRFCSTALITARRCRPPWRRASIAAWGDEEHVRANRAHYAAKFAHAAAEARRRAAGGDAGRRVLSLGAARRSTTRSSPGACWPRTGGHRAARQLSGARRACGQSRPRVRQDRAGAATTDECARAWIGSSALCKLALTRSARLSRHLAAFCRDGHWSRLTSSALRIPSDDYPLPSMAATRWLAALRPGFAFSWTAIPGHSAGQYGHRRRVLDRGSATVLASVPVGAVRRTRDRLLRQRRRAVGKHGARFVRLVIAVAIGAAIGIVLTILLKGYSRRLRDRASENVRAQLCRGLFQRPFRQPVLPAQVPRSARRRSAAQAEAERHLLEKQAVESELKLMQAQVEPHFLFNTLASVQYLTETDPPQATLLLGHLLAYLRAALPQLRKRARRSARRSTSPRRTSTSCRMRMGARLAFAIDVPDASARASVSAGAADFGRRERGHARARAAGRGWHTCASKRGEGDSRLVVTVIDTGRGLSGATSQPGQGVGLANVRERLAALFGTARPVYAGGCARRAAPARRSRSRSKI